MLLNSSAAAHKMLTPTVYKTCTIHSEIYYKYGYGMDAEAHFCHLKVRLQNIDPTQNIEKPPQNLDLIFENTDLLTQNNEKLSKFPADFEP